MRKRTLIAMFVMMLGLGGISLTLSGCESTEKANGDHPAGDHPEGDHPAGEHPE